MDKLFAERHCKYRSGYSSNYRRGIQAGVEIKLIANFNIKFKPKNFCYYYEEVTGKIFTPKIANSQWFY